MYIKINSVKVFFHIQKDKVELAGKEWQEFQVIEGNCVEISLKNVCILKGKIYV